MTQAKDTEAGLQAIETAMSLCPEALAECVRRQSLMLGPNPTLEQLELSMDEVAAEMTEAVRRRRA